MFSIIFYFFIIFYFYEVSFFVLANNIIWLNDAYLENLVFLVFIRYIQNTTCRNEVCYESNSNLLSPTTVQKEISKFLFGLFTSIRIMKNYYIIVTFGLGWVKQKYSSNLIGCDGYFFKWHNGWNLFNKIYFEFFW